MNLSELLAKLDRAQNALAFKVVASLVAVAIALGVVVTYGVRASAEAQERQRVTVRDFIGDLADEPPAGAAQPGGAQGGAAAGTGSGGAGAGLGGVDEAADREARRQLVQQADSLARFYNRLIDRKYSTGGFAAVVGLALVPVLGAIWLGLGLTYLALGVLAGLVVGPMLWLGGPAWRGAAVFTGGTVVLAASFAALIQLLRLLLSPATPITAIARNVVAEAVRLKISLVFIVMLILALALLPGLLDEQTPLRYRVQSFLQYGSAGSFWITAVLVLVLAAASVAFEQRDKIIWQTMTKPVRPWEFVVGKWLGVVGVAAVLLGVSSTGVFFFADYLRRTGLAVEEVRPYVPSDPSKIASEDRLILESQVLVGRESVRPLLPRELSVRVSEAVRERTAAQAQKFEQTRDPADAPDEAKIQREVEGEALAAFLSIGPGQSRTYDFVELGEARGFDMPMTLRYKVNSGANNPDDFHTVTFFLPGNAPFQRRVPAGQMMTMPLSTSAVQEVELEGRRTSALSLTVANIYPEGTPESAMRTMSFPPDGLEVSYARSSFEANYVRVALVLLVKLGFLAAIAVTAATFLSFPVACLVSFGTFLMAEGASAVSTALDNFDPVDGQTEAVSYWKYPVVWIARPVAESLKFYAELNPTGKLVEGRLLGWGDVGLSVVLLGGLTLGLLVVAGVIFRNRELATYSGQ
jgi:hypothetical protein